MNAQEQVFWTILQNRDRVTHNQLKKNRLSAADICNLDARDLLDMRLIGPTRISVILVMLEHCGYDPVWKDYIVNSPRLNPEYERVRKEPYG